jgi:hypothetical protein
MSTYKYKRLSEREFSGFGGLEEWDKLGADGWRLMHVYPSSRDGRSWNEYLFMRELEEKHERSLFDQVFGRRWE